MRPSDEQISAYVDGELDATEAASVAQALASDRALAQRVAAISQVRAALPHLIPEISDLDLAQLEEHADLTSVTDRTRGKSLLWAAATACCAVLLLAVSLVILNKPSEVGQKTWFEQAVRRHEAWGTSLTRLGKPLPLTVGVGGASDPVVVPDLRSAGLKIDVVERAEFSGIATVRAGYVGSRGCQLSLYVSSQVLPLTTYDNKQDGVLIASWTGAKYSYVMLALRMNPNRFNELAEIIAAATRRDMPIGPSAAARMAQTRRMSPPCRA